MTIKLNYMVRYLLMQFVNIADGDIIKLQYKYGSSKEVFSENNV